LFARLNIASIFCNKFHFICVLIFFSEGKLLNYSYVKLIINLSTGCKVTGIVETQSVTPPLSKYMVVHDTTQGITVHGVATRMR
jgi:hypothetical protein